jgi:hypothetical protein
MVGEAKRLASTVYRFAPDEQGAIDTARHFCKPGLLEDPLKRPSDFELHAAKQFNFRGWLTLNSWFRCKSAKLKVKNNPPVSGVVIEQDFNTPEVPDDSPIVFGPDQIRRFFADAPAELHQPEHRGRELAALRRISPGG